jgi:hypothetical protein
MENLLRNDFTAHYGLPVSMVADISVLTDAIYFEIEDDENREIALHFSANLGVAKYKNVNKLEVTLINYDKFLTSLPAAFQQGKGRCDLIVYTNDSPKYFLLNELTDTALKYVEPYINNRGAKIGKRAHATLQMLSTLKVLTDVASVKVFINIFSIKQCCFFNKQSTAPPSITATTAFGRFNSIAQNGLEMTNTDIEAFGFKYYEYSGTQTYAL